MLRGGADRNVCDKIRKCGAPQKAGRESSAPSRAQLRFGFLPCRICDERARSRSPASGYHCAEQPCPGSRFVHKAPHVTMNFSAFILPPDRMRRGEFTKPACRLRSGPCCVRGFVRHSAERNVPFFRIVTALSGGTSHRHVAMRTGTFGSSLKGIPPTGPSHRSAPPP